MESGHLTLTGPTPAPSAPIIPSAPRSGCSASMTGTVRYAETASRSGSGGEAGRVE